MKTSNFTKFAVEKILKTKMEQETKFQVYDLGGEELLNPQAKLRQLFEDLRAKQYQLVLEYVEQMPEFKITKISIDSALGIAEDVLSFMQEEGEKNLNKAFNHGQHYQDKVNRLFNVGFEVNNQHAKDRAKQQAGAMITGINETSRKEINNLLNSAMKNQLTKKELVEKLQTSFAFSKYRANMIANNEIGNAFIQGSITQHQELQKRTGIEGRKKRESHKDEKVSDVCRENENQDWIPFNQPFGSGHFSPLGHVNCRCVLRIRPFKPGEVDNLFSELFDKPISENIGLSEKNDYNGIVDYPDQSTKAIFSPNRELIKKYNIPTDIGEVNVEVLHAYTGNGFYFVNGYLRNGMFDEPWVKFMDKVLEKTIKDNAKYIKPVYRREGMTQERIDAIIQTGIYENKAYLSTTKDNSSVFAIGEGKKVKLEIVKHNGGMEIEKYSANPLEEEVLLNKGKRFKAKLKERKSDFITFILEEDEGK